MKENNFDFKMEEIKKMNIYEKIMWAGNEAHGVEKSIEVGFGNSKYKATGDGDVLRKAKMVESKYRLLTLVTDMEVIYETEKTVLGTGGKPDRTTFIKDIKVTTRIVNIDNPQEYIDVTSLGRGEDSGDKLYGKASTYARKYALLNIFKLVTGDDPDHEESTKGVSKTAGTKSTIAKTKNDLSTVVGKEKETKAQEEIKDLLVKYFEKVKGKENQEAISMASAKYKKDYASADTSKIEEAIKKIKEAIGGK